MTREMYERAVARMREAGHVRENDYVSDSGRMVRAAVVSERLRSIAEGVDMAKAWMDLAADVGGLVSLSIYRSPISSEFDGAKVEWLITREVSADEVAAQEVERCAG